MSKWNLDHSVLEELKSLIYVGKSEFETLLQKFWKRHMSIYFSRKSKQKIEMCPPFNLIAV